MDDRLEFKSEGGFEIKTKFDNGGLKAPFASASIGQMGPGMQALFNTPEPIAVQSQENKSKNDTLFGAGVGLIEEAIKPKPSLQMGGPRPTPFGI